MRPFKIWFVVMVVVAVLGCERRPESVRVDFDRAGLALTARFESIFDNPAIDHGVDGFLDALGGNPALGSAGERLLGALQSDPKVTTEIDKLIGEITASPRLGEIMLTLAKDNPGRDPSELVGEKIEKAWAAPAISKTMEEVGQELVRKIKADELTSVASAIEAKLDSLIGDSQRTAAWGKRLTELNGGSVPDRARATDLYMKTAWSDAHVSAFLTAVLANPAVRTETATAVAEILAVAPITTEFRRGVTLMVSDPELRAVAVSLVLDLLEPQVDVAKLKQRERELLLGPHVIQMGQKLVHILATEPAIAKIVNTHIARLGADPALHKAFFDFLDHW